MLGKGVMRLGREFLCLFFVFLCVCVFLPFPLFLPQLFKFGAAWRVCSAGQDEREKEEASREEEEAGKKEAVPTK